MVVPVRIQWSGSITRFSLESKNLTQVAFLWIAVAFHWPYVFGMVSRSCRATWDTCNRKFLRGFHKAQLSIKPCMRNWMMRAHDLPVLRRLRCHLQRSVVRVSRGKLISAIYKHWGVLQRYFENDTTPTESQRLTPAPRYKAKGPSKRPQHLLQHRFDFVEWQCWKRLPPPFDIVETCWKDVESMLKEFKSL